MDLGLTGSFLICIMFNHFSWNFQNISSLCCWLLSWSNIFSQDNQIIFISASWHLHMNRLISTVYQSDTKHNFFGVHKSMLVLRLRGISFRTSVMLLFALRQLNILAFTVLRVRPDPSVCFISWLFMRSIPRD